MEVLNRGQAFAEEVSTVEVFVVSCHLVSVGLRALSLNVAEVVTEIIERRHDTVKVRFELVEHDLCGSCGSAGVVGLPPPDTLFVRFELGVAGRPSPTQLSLNRCPFTIRPVPSVESSTRASDRVGNTDTMASIARLSAVLRVFTSPIHINDGCISS
jgi:hypothetical protein